MSTFWISLVVFHLLSIGFLAMSLMRLFSYLRQYPLKENHHTMLFGWIRVEYVVFAYIFCIALYTVGSVIFVTSLPNS